MRRTGTRNQLLIVVIAGLLLVICPWGRVAAQKPAKKSGPQTSSSQLVWPLPPEKPRFRFVQEIRGSIDIEPVQKTSLLARLSGIRRQEFRPSFVKPFGVSTDSRHRIFVTDNGQAMVFVLDPYKHEVSYIGLDSSPRLRTPMGITVDALDRVWLADAGAQRIYAFDSGLTLRAAIGKQGELMNPVGVATDLRRQRLYVADSKQHCIVVYDTETGLLVAKFGKRGVADGQFNFPTGVTVDPKGNLYVADMFNHRIQVFDPNYTFLEKFGTGGVEWGRFRKPKSVALDSFGNIYVLDSDLSNFQVFDPKKRLLMFLGEFGNGPGQFAIPEQIHIDLRDTIYIVDQLNQRVQILQLLSGETDDVSAVAATNDVKKQ